MSAEAPAVPRPRRARRRYVHLGAEAVLANGERHVMIVRLDRAANALEFRARRSSIAYTVPLSRALGILARVLDKERAERELKTAPALPIRPRML